MLEVRFSDDEGFIAVIVKAGCVVRLWVHELLFFFQRVHWVLREVHDVASVHERSQY